MIVSSTFNRSKAAMLGLFLGLSLSLASCGSTYQRYDEAFVRVGIHGDASAPEWVQGDIPQATDTLYFIGNAVGYDVLDERGAYDAATAHARQQLAEFIATRVTSRVHEEDLSDGVRYLPRPAEPGTPESLHQELSEEVCQITDAFVGDLVTVSKYWEQWDIREKPEKHLYPYNHRLRRYKLWVLMSIDRASLNRRVAETVTTLSNEQSLRDANEALANSRLRWTLTSHN